MKGCDDYSATIQLYLDRELSGQDLEDFQAHLKECEACRTELEEHERLSALLQRSRPLYSAPDALRVRVMQGAESLPSTSTHPAVRLRKLIAPGVGVAIAGCRLWRSQLGCVSCHNSSRCCRAPTPPGNCAAVTCRQLY
jgi:mycothiol system anti-sigma-R factor